jgi:subtilisin family serine protease
LKNEPLHDALASHPAVVTIGASSSRNQRAGYSSWGRHVSLCAPSNDYPPTSWLKRLRFTPETRRITVPWNRRFKVAGHRPPKNPKRPYRDDFGGTSAATAIVAGAVGLIRSVAPDLHADQVKEILFSTALKIVDPQSDMIFKARYGVYGQVGQCNWFGHGKIDIAAAVREAKRVTELRGRS